MKKHLLSAVVLLTLLILFFPILACADVIYPAPGELVVGTPVNHLLATLDPDDNLSVSVDQLPDGLFLATDEGEGGVNVYLRGTPTTPGTYDCVLRYNDSSVFLTLNIVPVEVPDPVLDSVSVETLPVQTEYTAGDMLDQSGLTLRAMMSDGSSQLITEGFHLYPTRLENDGVQTIEVNYQDKLCYFTVNVAPAPEIIEGIGVLTLPEKVVYNLGEFLETRGLSIRVYTNNGTRDVSEDLQCSPLELNTAGSQSITVEYGGKHCTFTVQVQEPETPASLAVYHLPDKMDYTVGDMLETRGLVLLVSGSSYTTTEISSGFNCYPIRLDTAGSQEITVQYGELSCSFYVTVREAPISPAPDSDPVPSPTAAPATQQPAVGTPDPGPVPHAGPQNGILVIIIIVAAMLALAVLGIYVFVMNRGGREFFAETIREIFRRR